MHPVISISIYLLMQLMILYILIRCLYRNPALPQGSAFFRRFLMIAGVLYLLAGMLPVAGTLLPASRIKYTLQGAGDIWLGFALYFNGIVFILYLFLTAADIVCRRKKRGLRQIFVPAAGLLAAAVLFAYGMLHAQDTGIRVYDISADKEAGMPDELKVVLIADLHLGINSRLSMIQKMADQINEQQADAVVVAGDVFNSAYESLRHPEQYAQALRGIRAKYGVYAVYGNHDVEETLFGGFSVSPISMAYRSGEMEQFFSDCGFTVLCDEAVTIADGAVQLAGRIDGEKAGDGTSVRKSPSEVLKGLDRGKYTIVVQHEPVEFAQLKENGADLALCGHTHDGQLFPGNLIVKLFFENTYGYKTISGLDTIVTSGIGYYGPPMRVGTDSEITVIRIHFDGMS